MLFPYSISSCMAEQPLRGGRWVKDYHCLQKFFSEKCIALWIYFFFTPFPVPILFISMFFIIVNLNLD